MTEQTAQEALQALLMASWRDGARDGAFAATEGILAVLDVQEQLGHVVIGIQTMRQAVQAVREQHGARSDD